MPRQRHVKHGAVSSLCQSANWQMFWLASHTALFLTQARLPPGFTRARLSILLEVMESRKVVATEKGTSASVRWQLRA
tara:strand:- start:125 stop:358 length:234 start_codon:yes stop_codon:yes gene_type:complete